MEVNEMIPRDEALFKEIVHEVLNFAAMMNATKIDVSCDGDDMGVGLRVSLTFDEKES